MSLDLYHHLHHRRAEELEHDAAIGATIHRLRRAKRLERTARWLDAGAEWASRLAGHVHARARASRTRLL